MDRKRSFGDSQNKFMDQYFRIPRRQKDEDLSTAPITTDEPILQSLVQSLRTDIVEVQDHDLLLSHFDDQLSQEELVQVDNDFQEEKRWQRRHFSQKQRN